MDTFLSTYPGSAVVLDVLGTLDAGEIRAKAPKLELAIRSDVAITVEAWIDDGAFRSLFRLIDLASSAAVRPRRALPRDERGALAGASQPPPALNWIQEIGAQAAAVARVRREVVGHLDWAAKHVRFDDRLRPSTTGTA